MLGRVSCGVDYVSCSIGVHPSPDFCCSSASGGFTNVFGSCISAFPYCQFWKMETGDLRETVFRHQSPRRIPLTPSLRSGSPIRDFVELCIIPPTSVAPRSGYFEDQSSKRGSPNLAPYSTTTLLCQTCLQLCNALSSLHK